MNRLLIMTQSRRGSGKMVQLQCSIELKGEKLQIQINQLFREDATEEEKTVVKHLEQLIMDIHLSVARQEGMQVRTRKVKAIPF